VPDDAVAAFDGLVAKVVGALPTGASD
jgi:hypothetical protein